MNRTVLVTVFLLVKYNKKRYFGFLANIESVYATSLFKCLSTIIYNILYPDGPQRDNPNR